MGAILNGIVEEKIHIKPFAHVASVNVRKHEDDIVDFIVWDDSPEKEGIKSQVRESFRTKRKRKRTCTFSHKAQLIDR